MGPGRARPSTCALSGVDVQDVLGACGGLGRARGVVLGRGGGQLPCRLLVAFGRLRLGLGHGFHGLLSHALIGGYAAYVHVRCLPWCALTRAVSLREGYRRARRNLKPRVPPVRPVHRVPRAMGPKRPRGCGSSFAGFAVFGGDYGTKVTQTGAPRVTAWPIGVSLPVRRSRRKTTRLSESWLAARSQRPVGSRAK